MPNPVCGVHRGAQEPSALCPGGRVGVPLRRRETVGETGEGGEMGGRR